MLIGSGLWVGYFVGHGSNVSISVKIHFIFIGFSRVSNNYILIPTGGVCAMLQQTIQLEHFYLFLSVHGLYQIRTRTPPFPLCLFWLRIRKADVSVVSTLDICGNTVLCSCQLRINTTLSRNGSIMIWMFLVSKFKFIHIIDKNDKTKGTNNLFFPVVSYRVKK